MMIIDSITIFCKWTRIIWWIFEEITKCYGELRITWIVGTRGGTESGRFEGEG